MKNRMILSPFFLDEALPELEFLATPEWQINKPDLQTVFNHLRQSGNVAAVSMSTWNPEMDRDGQSRKLWMRLLATLLADK